jgi:hypothetical protein
MTLQNIGYILVVLGGGTFIGGGGVVRGFKGHKGLLSEYRAARAARKKPTGDQQFAYYAHLCNVTGLPLLAVGLLLLLLSNTFGI